MKEFNQKRVIKRLNCTIKNTIKTALSILLLIGISNSVKCQNDIDSSAPAKLITRFPFTIISGGVMIVAARLDSFPDSLHFILDTGSGGISLDSLLVDELKLPKQVSERTLKGIANIRRVSYVMSRTLHLPNLDVENLNFHLNDYELLTSTYGIRIDGIIGYSFLKQFIVKVDYDHNMIEVWTQGKIKYPRRGYLLRPTINGIPVFDATVEDERLTEGKFFFDTGAGLCLLMSDEYVKDSAIFKQNKRMIITQVEGLGSKKQMRMTTVKSIKVGPYQFKKVPAHIFDDEFNVTNYPELGGLIGNDLLRRFNIIINYAKMEIHLKPNSHFREDFDYSYTGLGIYLANGNVIIEDVLPNSPGEKAGLKAGDTIVGIDNVFTGSIQTYKDMLQQIGSQLRLLILRDSKAMVFWLKVNSFLKDTK